ncbi:MAG: HNH endonuclease (endogenous virus) [Lactobacillus phage ViSo-2018a]|uniref:HNH homing endonuclease n=1 Tax=Lactobacillus phage ViSo-2018a TaxID=2267607 RepID=A0A3G6JHH7_9CAUD|nr:MAG: HNH endonuclease [Lactobacillus phage ViSo-2018a]AZA17321.1 MAG: HNH homing endonuclease [Lactobacillus phage ViSo-2018a]
MKQRDNGHGYMFVSFSVNGKRIYLYVHRIVAICFIPNPNNYLEINHIDCNRVNNRLDNLEWCTHQENMTYSNKLGHMVNGNPGHHVIAVNPETSEVFWFESQREAGRQLGFYQSNIRSVLKGQYAQTGGYWFCDADENAVEKVRAKFGDEVANKVERLMSKN